MLDRRSFTMLTALTAAAGVSALAATPRKEVHSTLKPRKLAPGDTVGLVAPASQAFESDQIKLSREQLEALGLRVVVGKHAFDRYGYFAGADRDRAADINSMFADPAIDGIFAFTGGWGSPRLLPLLDYATIERNPKVFVGFSDITALLNGIHQRTGLVTFHGPVAHSNFEAFTLENFKRVVMSSDPVGVLSNPRKQDDQLVNRDYRIRTIHAGKASGRLVGGNLTLLCATMGTPWEIETEGTILLLEDVHEEIYRVDRMLTQLWLAGKLDKVSGLVFGRCSECPVTGPSLSLEQLLDERFGSARVPAISGFAFGHIEKKLTLPIGLMATLDADAGTISINEGAVTDGEARAARPPSGSL